VPSDDFLIAKEMISYTSEDEFEFQQNYYKADSNSTLILFQLSPQDFT